MSDRVRGKRALVTSADRYMGPAITKLFAAEGADVVSSTHDLRGRDAAAALIERTGHIDILVANLAVPPHRAATKDASDDDWEALIEGLVYPLMRLTRAVLPQMQERKSGKIVAMTSAAPLRGIPKVTGYAAARGAQNAFVRSVGLEVAGDNVQVNAVAQNYVENDTYYPPELTENAEMLARMTAVVPLGRLAKPEESAALALFLASNESDFIVGQVVPFAGGWATTTG